MAKQIAFQGKELDANTRNAIAANVLVEGARPLSWWRKQSNDLQGKFMREMRTSLENGESAAQAATRITGGTIKGVQVPGIMNTSKRNANTLARTALNKVTNEARIASFEANSDMVKALKQISTLDNRTSEICIAYDGQVWENTPEKKPVSPSTLPFNGGPPRHFNCRSTLVPVLKSWEELGIPAKELEPSTRASMDGQVPEDTTFDDFLKSKGTEFQNKILGPAKARLWRSGKITLQQLVDFRGNPLSVEQLEKIVAAKASKARAAASVAKTAADKKAAAVGAAQNSMRTAKQSVATAKRTLETGQQSRAASKAARLSIESAETTLEEAGAAVNRAKNLTDIKAVRAETAAARQFIRAAELAAAAAAGVLLAAEDE